VTVRVERDGAVSVVTIDRPAVRNAVDGVTAQALADAFREFAADDDAHVAVLTGAGGTFCAGADLTAMLRGQQGNRVSSEGDGPMGPTRMLLEKPVLAAIEGHAVAGGLELALWCDMRIAGRDAVFGVYCRRWGVPLIDGGTVRLPRLVGLSHALDLILTGRGVSGDEALAIGLANRLSEPGGALDDARALAHELARLPQVCLRSDRRSAYEQEGMALEDALAHEFRLGAATLDDPETGQGIRRFAEGAGRHGTPA
jgi:enoyl-CoA hydratase